MSDTGVESLELSYGPTQLQGSCSLCGMELLKSDITYYFEFENRKEEAQVWAFHDTCFFHITLTIKQFLANNKIKTPKEFKLEKDKVN